MVFSQPGLWRHQVLRLGPLERLPDEERAQWFAAKSALLRRVGPFIAHLRVAASPTWHFDPTDATAASDAAAAAAAALSAAGLSIISLFSLLCRPLAGRLRRLTICCHELLSAEAAAVQAAACFPQLTSLALNAGASSLSADASAAIGSLASLRRLRVHAVEVPAALIEAVARLGRLSRLELVCWDALPPVRALGALSCLRLLKLWEGDRNAGALELPPPAEFPQLRAFDFDCGGQRFQVGAGCCGGTHRSLLHSRRCYSEPRYQLGLACTC